MNLQETNRLLTQIAAIDNRRYDDAAVLTWQKILANIAYDDAHQAVTDHFAHNTAYLMPAHIVDRAKAIHDERRRQQPHPIRELPSRFEPDPDRAARAHRGAALVAATLGQRDDEKPLDPDNPIRDRALRRARAERGTRALTARAETSAIGNLAAAVVARRRPTSS